MNLRSSESRAEAKALLKGMVVPTLLIALFIASARATYSPAPVPSNLPAQPATAAAKPSAVAPMPVPTQSNPQVPMACASKRSTSTRVASHGEATAPVVHAALAVATDAAPMLVLAGAEGACAAGSSYAYSDDHDRGFFWALVEGREDGKRQTVGSTDERAQRMITRALRGERGKFLYLRIDDRDYIVRDPETIAAASELVEPMEVLGRKMGELGGRQGALGGRQGALGGEQGMLGARQARLALRQASLATEIRSRERRGLSTSSLENEQERIEAAMRECSRRQTELGRRQSELGGRQSALGAEQSRYGEEMSRVSAEVDKAMRKLARKAIESGEAMELTDDDA